MAPAEVSQIDNKMVSAVYQEVLKMMQQNPSSPLSDGFQQASVNFAGIISAFQVDFAESDKSDVLWIIDTGASDLMAFNSMLFTDIHNISQPITICLPDGSNKIVNLIGNVMLTSNILLQNVLYVPNFKHNLLSGWQIS